MPAARSFRGRPSSVDPSTSRPENYHLICTLSDNGCARFDSAGEDDFRESLSLTLPRAADHPRMALTPKKGTFDNFHHPLMDARLFALP